MRGTSVLGHPMSPVKSISKIKSIGDWTTIPWRDAVWGVEGEVSMEPLEEQGDDGAGKAGAEKTEIVEGAEHDIVEDVESDAEMGELCRIDQAQNKAAA